MTGVYERLSQNTIIPQDLELDEFFENVADPFEGLKTVYMQEKVLLRTFWIYPIAMAIDYK